MSLSDSIKQQVEKILGPYCVKRIPPHARNQVRLTYGFRGNSVTLFEERPAFDEPERWLKFAVAQFRYHEDSEAWTLYCADRNSRWHNYFETESTTNLESLLQEVDDDPTGIFWG